MTKQTPPKFAAGNKVRSSTNKEDVLTVKGEPSWNGFTWMYAFDEIDMRCGEGYLKLEINLEVSK